MTRQRNDEVDTLLPEETNQVWSFLTQQRLGEVETFIARQELIRCVFPCYNRYLACSRRRQKESPRSSGLP